MQIILGDRLVGLYLYGSLVSGDFDQDISDIDVLAATSSEIDEAAFNALAAMHEEIVTQQKQWENRIEIAYVSLDTLKTFKTRPGKIVLISPGEPFHVKDAGNDWLLNRYFIRESGATLFGPPPQAIIAPISKGEFIQAVKAQVADWREYFGDERYSRNYQAYVILTLCRALYAYTNGEQVSKIQAALWAQKELPAWASTIQSALFWRQAWRDNHVDHDATLPETRRFVNFIIDRILD